jgi:hypothetical protein
MTSTRCATMWPAPSWPQKCSWQWRIAEALSLPVREPRNCLMTILPSLIRRSPGQNTIRLIGGPDPSIHNQKSGVHRSLSGGYVEASEPPNSKGGWKGEATREVPR